MKKDTLNLLIHLVGSGVSMIQVALSVFLYAHGLSASEYGAFSVFLTVVLILSGLGEMGASNIILAKLPQLAHNSHAASEIFLKSIFFLSNLSTLVFSIIFILTFQYMDKVVYKTGFPILTVLLGIATMFTFLWRSILSSVLLSLQRVVTVNLLNISTNLVQLVIMYILYLKGALSVNNILLVIIVVTMLHIIFFLTHILSNKVHKIWNTKVDFQALHLEMILTNFFAQQVFQMSLRSDLFIFSYFNILASRADYALAQKIVLTTTTFISALIQLYTPEFSRVVGKDALVHLGKKRLPYFIVSLMIFVALLMLPDGLYMIFFTSKFPLVGAFTRLLSLVYMVFVIYALCELILLYTFKDAKAVLWSNLTLFSITAACGLVLISIYGYSGGAVALGVGLVTSTFLRLVMIQRHLKTK